MKKGLHYKPGEENKKDTEENELIWRKKIQFGTKLYMARDMFVWSYPSSYIGVIHYILYVDSGSGAFQGCHSLSCTI